MLEMAPHAFGKAIAGDIAHLLRRLSRVVDRLSSQISSVSEEARCVARRRIVMPPPIVAIQRLPSSGNNTPPRLFWGAWPKVITPFQSVGASFGMSKTHAA